MVEWWWGEQKFKNLEGCKEIVAISGKAVGVRNLALSDLTRCSPISTWTNSRQLHCLYNSRN
jgi:hypothetical protein